LEDNDCVLEGQENEDVKNIIETTSELRLEILIPSTSQRRRF